MKNRIVPRAKVAQAFTLIELLVVVAVIALLAGLALPGFKKAMATAKRSNCVEYERQIASGLSLYAAEHNNMLPAVNSLGMSGPEQNRWNYQIWTYCGYAEGSYQYPYNDACNRKSVKVTQKNIFRCPESFGDPKCVPGVTINGNRMSYALNAPLTLCIPTVPAPLEGAGVVPLASVPNPARTAMVVEGSFTNGGCWYYFYAWGLIPHDDGMNVLYYDGHVQYLKFAEIPTQSTDTFWSGQ